MQILRNLLKFWLDLDCNSEAKVSVTFDASVNDIRANEFSLFLLDFVRRKQAEMQIGNVKETKREMEEFTNVILLNENSFVAQKFTIVIITKR